MKVGILGLQGSVGEHLDFLRTMVGNDSVALVKKSSDVEGLNGLIIPGGESTTIGKLMRLNGINKAIKRNKKLAILGTCAGAILLAKEIKDSDQFTLGLMDIAVERNAYGRQRESFETAIKIPVLGEKLFKAVFIRAPIIKDVGKGVEVLATRKDEPVLVRQGIYLACTFHPELVDDKRVHEYFLGIMKNG
jgi:5'-phosphate synthase pdxT subunit